MNILGKVLRYETFINDVLKEQLKKIHSELDKIHGEIAEYVQLRSTIETLKDTGLAESQMKIQVDIGSNFYMQAKISDPKTIYIDIGLKTYLECTLEEAVQLIDLRTKLLFEIINKLQEQSANTKAHIKLVLHGLQELQKI
uniref:Prefoldin subunit 5 n=1 Tax=Clastoptera arizonana TaxID=38151 RepID=A0A1B6CV90_9HEMI